MKELYFVIIFMIFTWFVSQCFKFLLKFFIEKKLDFKIFISDGGFPSTHTTFAVSGTFILFLYLLPILIARPSNELSIISLCILFFSILWASTIIRDAFGIRYSVQKLSLIFQEILMNKNNEVLPKSIANNWKEKSKLITLSTGHTPLEVLGGVALGIMFGFMYAFIRSKNIFNIIYISFIIIVYFFIVFIVKKLKSKKNTI